MKARSQCHTLRCIDKTCSNPSIQTLTQYNALRLGRTSCQVQLRSELLILLLLLESLLLDWAVAEAMMKEQGRKNTCCWGKEYRQRIQCTWRISPGTNTRPAMWMWAGGEKSTFKLFRYQIVWGLENLGHRASISLSVYFLSGEKQKGSKAILHFCTTEFEFQMCLFLS